MAITSGFLEYVLSYLKRGVELGGFPEDFYKIMARPQRILMVSIPVRMDNGGFEVFEGYRVQHCGVLVLLRVVFVFIRRLPLPTMWLWLCL
jgi:hypothetical protein